MLANAGFSLLRSTLAGNTAVVPGATGGAVGEGGALFGGANPGIRTIASSTISGNAAADSGGGIELNGDASAPSPASPSSATAAPRSARTCTPTGGSPRRRTRSSAPPVPAARATARSSPSRRARTSTSARPVASKAARTRSTRSRCWDSLDDNGGPTLTHAPLAGSPAIDMTSRLRRARARSTLDHAAAGHALRRGRGRGAVQAVDREQGRLGRRHDQLRPHRHQLRRGLHGELFAGGLGDADGDPVPGLGARFLERMRQQQRRSVHGRARQLRERVRPDGERELRAGAARAASRGPAGGDAAEAKKKCKKGQKLKKGKCVKKKRKKP